MSEKENYKNWESPPGGTGAEFDSAAIGALAHLYRGEVYRSTMWRTRLDTTTNWSVVTLGVALSIAFASPEASAVPLVLVGLLVAMFLILEARRYRYFNVWRARARWIETNFYAPLLFRSQKPDPGPWQDVLAKDYMSPHYHIGFWRAVGRRLHRNYMWIFSFQAVAYLGKVTVHPSALENVGQLFDRMALGPIPGIVVFTAGGLFHASWICLALWSQTLDNRAHSTKTSVSGMG